ncbi:MAG: DUF87 domain-containing protein [Alphaproteobacteria bacterium]|nr:DUF87 domain-containing protein [Alphaproteobacteria bacterium]
MIENLTEKLTETLSHFGIIGQIGKVFEGPLITDIQFLPNTGTKFTTIANSIKDIARELGVSGVRVAPVIDSTYISFEIPNPDRKTIDFVPLLQSEEFLSAKGALPILIGVDMHGKPVMKDLAKMPHLLVAGTTGSGKSVGLNSFILSLVNKKSPDELKLILVDPKRIEFSMYNKQRYMLCPAVTDMSMAARWLEKLCDEMNARYAVFEKAMVRNIGEYIEKGNKMPYIVCVIDEFADLILFDKNVEKQVQILAQKSRAAGIHLVIATQRPSVDVITGVIKANLPTRLSYKVSSPTDSMTILNTAGAEDLLGRGDSLLLEENGTFTRTLGAYVPNDDIMSLLAPHRCEMCDINYDGIITGQQIQSQTAEYIAQQEKASAEALNNTQQQGFIARVQAWWSKLDKTWQRRIVNIGIAFITALVTSKNSGKNAKKSAIQSATDAAVKSAKRTVKTQAKQAITKAVLDSLNKK